MSDQEEQMGEVIVTAITKKVGARNDYTYWARRFWKIQEQMQESKIF
jgi:hypothetical protein